MTSYSIEYYIKNDPSMTIYTKTIDAKDLRSAKRKIEVKHANLVNRSRSSSKQIKFVRINIIDYTIIGYY